MSEDIKLDGPVEMDETYHGGATKNKHANKRKQGLYKDKQPILGMVERSGRVTTQVVTDTKATTVLPIVAERVLPSTMVYTDDYPIYDGLARMGYQHSRIHHTARVYVMGDVHTQTIEGFWSLLKRGIGGVYHAVSTKYLQSYCDE